MCWEDIKIGRLSQGGQKNFALTTTVSGVASAQPLRTLISFSLLSGDPVGISGTGPAADGVGFRLTIGDNPAVFDIRRYGGFVTREFTAIVLAGGAAANLSVITVTTPLESKDGS